MAEYIIVSPRVGTPGELWEPIDGVNIDALIAGGFIRRVEYREPSPSHPKASRVKPKSTPDTEPTE